jgi:hypothetical protein
MRDLFVDKNALAKDLLCDIINRLIQKVLSEKNLQ